MLRVPDTAPPLETALDSPTNGGALLALQLGLKERLEELLERLEQATSVGGHFDAAVSINASEATMPLSILSADNPHLAFLAVIAYFIAKIAKVTMASDRDLRELVADLNLRNEIAGIRNTLKKLRDEYPALSSDAGQILQTDISF